MKPDRQKLVLIFYTIAWFSFSFILTGQHVVRFKPLEYVARSPELRQDVSGDIANKTARALASQFPNSVGQDMQVFTEQPIFTLPLIYWLYPSNISLLTPEVNESNEDKQSRVYNFISNPRSPVVVYIGSEKLLEQASPNPPSSYKTQYVLKEGPIIVKRYSK